MVKGLKLALVAIIALASWVVYATRPINWRRIWYILLRAKYTESIIVTIPCPN
jgi:hypothetical protein